MAGQERRPGQAPETQTQRQEALELITAVYGIEPPHEESEQYTEAQLIQAASKAPINSPLFRGAMRQMIFYHSAPRDRKTFVAAFYGKSVAELDALVQAGGTPDSTATRPVTPARPVTPPPASPTRPPERRPAVATPADPGRVHRADLHDPNAEGSRDARVRQEKMTTTQREIQSILNAVIHGQVKMSDIIPGTHQSYEAKFVQLSNREDGYKDNGGGLVEATIGAYKTKFEALRAKSGESAAKKYILQVAEQIKTADMFGFIPKALILPGTNFMEFKGKFKGLMHDYGLNGLEAMFTQEQLEDMTTEERMKAYRQQQQAMAFAGEEGAGVDVGGERRDMSLDGWLMEGHAREISMLYDKLPSEVQDQINARITGIMWQAGRGAKKTQLVWDVISADTLGSTYQAAIRNGIFQAGLEKQRGYLGGEDILKVAGFVEPEKLNALVSQKIDNIIWIKDRLTGEIKEKKISISTQDVWAELYSVKSISELLAVDPLGTKPPIVDGKFDVERSNGYFNMKAKLLYRTLFRKLGLSREEAAAAAGAKTLSAAAVKGLNPQQRAEYDRAMSLIPNIVATNQLSLVDRQNVDSLDQWVGQYWWMIMDAEAYMLYGRSDFAVAPLENMTRRLDLGLRKILLAHYPTMYNMLNTPEQQIHGQNMLPELPAQMVDQMIKTMKNRVKKQPGTPQAIKAREKIVERMGKLEQMQPSMGREMGMMMLGLGKYEPVGNTNAERIADWKNKVRGGLLSGSKVGIQRNRLFDFWRDIDFDGAELQLAWEGFDFTELLQMCNCSEGDFAKWKREGKSVKGVSGFNLFREYANGNLYDLMNKEGASVVKYGLTDGFVRYLGRIQGAIENRWKFSQSAVLDPGVSTTKLNRISDKKFGERDFASAYTRYTDLTQGVLVKSVQEYLSLAGFGDSKIQQDDLLAAIDLFLEGNLAFRDDSYVVDVDARKKDPDDVDESSEIGAGNKFCILPLNYKHFRDRWGQILRNPTEADFLNMERFMRSEHFYFVNSIEEDSGKVNGTRNKAVLVGPHTSYIPSVIRVRDLLPKLDGIAENDRRIREDLLRANGVSEEDIELDEEIIRMDNYQEKLRYMEQKGWFCWNMLTRGSANLSLIEVGILYDALSSMFGVTDVAVKNKVDNLINKRRQERDHNVILDAIIGPDDMVLVREPKSGLTRFTQWTANDFGSSIPYNTVIRHVKGRVRI